MTNDDIIRMAEEAGMTRDGDMWFSNGKSDMDVEHRHLVQFAALVAAHEREHYDNLFQHIKGWCEAYPISVFPETGFGKAREVLKANGMTLDAISASNMKHVITQVQKMIDEAIRARGQQ